MKKITLLVLLLAGFATRSLATSALFGSSKWPPPDGMFVGLNAVSFPNGVVASNITFRSFSQGFALPPLGVTQFYPFGALAQMQISFNSGASFSSVLVPGNMLARVFHSSDLPRISFYYTEMLQMDISGGTFMIRESPTLVSSGQITERFGSNGELINSFFDVSVEVSLDGGLTWVPGNTTVSLELRADPTSVPSDTVSTTLLPPPCCAYTNAGSFLATIPVELFCETQSCTISAFLSHHRGPMARTFTRSRRKWIFSIPEMAAPVFRRAARQSI